MQAFRSLQMQLTTFSDVRRDAAQWRTPVQNVATDTSQSAHVFCVIHRCDVSAIAADQ